MKVIDLELRGKDRNLEINDTMRSLNWFLQIFALNSSIKPNRKTWRSLITKITVATILGLFNFSTLWFKFPFLYVYINVSIVFTNLVQTILDFCQYVVDLYFVYKCDKNILQYYQKFADIDDILDVRHYSKIKKRLMKLLWLATFSWMTSSICDLSAWFIYYGWMVPLFYSPAYIFLLTKILTSIHLTFQVMNIEYRLSAMGNTLENLYNNTKLSTISFMKGHARSYAWKSKVNQKRSSFSQNRYYETKRITKCYLFLIEQCTFINNIYGKRVPTNQILLKQNLNNENCHESSNIVIIMFQISLISLSLLVDVVRFANVAIRVLVGTQVFNLCLPRSFILIYSYKLILFKTL